MAFDNRLLVMLFYKKFEIDPNADWVVFIHGAGGSSAVWHKQIKPFKSAYNLLLIDLRGHGKSAETEDWAKKTYSFKAIAEDVINVLDHLQIQKAHFVGVSLGTIIIRQIADMRESLVKSMILTGAISRLNFKSQFFVNMGNAFKRVVPYMWLYKLFAWVIMPYKTHTESRITFVNEAKKLCQKEFLRWFKLTAQVNPILRYLEEKHMHIPTLYIMGSEDHMFLGPVAELVKRGKMEFLHIIEKCGHVVNIERAAEFNEHSLAWLAQKADGISYLK
ncbi:MAG: alpha/beta hydrolase [Salibacter sp.]|uniref:alpha/beta fold hydrolase n=1 Tax=Salibacter sp. TaxID=2010995 RepID=UPI00286FE948|nr:alpha/beta hydrolase [Salibacter sp.]MDR9397678.1 alpha/beta hydrolase [Salibacter sp.]